MLQVEERAVGNVVVVDLIGRLKEGDSGVLLRDKIHSLLYQGHRQFVLNLRAVQIMDSVGFGALVDVGTTVAHAGGRLVLTNAKPSTSQLLIMTGVLTHFPVFDSEAKALAMFRQPDPKSGVTTGGAEVDSAAAAIV